MRASTRAERAAPAGAEGRGGRNEGGAAARGCPDGATGNSCTRRSRRAAWTWRSGFRTSWPRCATASASSPAAATGASRLEVALPRRGPGRGGAAYVERRLAAANEADLQERLQPARCPSAVPSCSGCSAPPFRPRRGDAVISLASLVPLILILMTITGAVYPAIDLTAGERERGTLEILVAAPVPRLEPAVRQVRRRADRGRADRAGQPRRHGRHAAAQRPGPADLRRPPAVARLARCRSSRCCCCSRRSSRRCC